MLTFLIAFLIGTLFEYLLHRMVGHGPGVNDSQASLLSRHVVLHHRVYTERRGYAAYRTEARRAHVHLQFRAIFILLSLIVVAVVFIERFFGLEHAIWAASGLLTVLVAYDVLHWMHHARLPEVIAKLPLYAPARRWHHQHHAEPESRFAIVLPLWDLLFFTHKGLPEVKRGPVEPEPEAAAEPRSTRRRIRADDLQAMMAETLSEAEAQFEDDGETTKTARGRRGGKRGRKRSGTDSGRPTTTRRVKQPGWMRALDRAMEEDMGDVQVSAVREDEE
jgi:hypothetical protein